MKKTKAGWLVWALKYAAMWDGISFILIVLSGKESLEKKQNKFHQVLPTVLFHRIN